jgi:hypothetical protein
MVGGILPCGSLRRQAQIRAEEIGCQGLCVRRRKLYGADTAASSSGTKSKLVEADWKWFVPLGCFTMAALFVVFVGSVVLIVFDAVKSTDVYRDALARAKMNPDVIEALGSPITEGFLCQETQT